MDSEIISWLLGGDVSIQCQVHRDLLNTEKTSLRDRISQEGWGAAFLSQRKANGHWGQAFYQPKWISTHYTLLYLLNLCISPDTPAIQESLAIIFRDEKGPDGGIRPIGTVQKSDVCINGMLLNYASYFGVAESELESVVDFLLAQHMPDGGFNCMSNRKGAVHSSLHSTISVAEGLQEYKKNGYRYRLAECQKAEVGCRDFMLQHRLFKSDKTGEIINKKMLLLSYPSRWYYDILRALDYFQYADVPYEPRMDDALDVLLSKRRKDGTWPLQAKHSGRTHFDMEKGGCPSRWNTLRALRVLAHMKKIEAAGGIK